jgi:hypothetical protein
MPRSRSVALNDGREHYAPVFSLPPDEARQEMMRSFADPDQFEQIGLIPLGTTEPSC